MTILDAAASSIFSPTNTKKVYSPSQFIFGYDIILPIKHMVDWELIIQRKKAQINKYNILENRHGVEYDYKVGDNAMLTKHTEYKYETPYKGPIFDIKVFYQCHGKFTMWCGKN